MKEPPLRRFWFEFELPPRELGGRGISLDGDTAAERHLWSGCGVTGYDEQDCLVQVQLLLADEPMPQVARSIPDVDISSLGLDPARLGVPVWRGVWYPRQPYATER